MNEAIAWLEDKGVVAIYCEAIHSFTEPLDTRKAHRKRRGFEAICGTSTLCVTAILVAINSGACQNLDADMRCRIYERRPLVCRIYPAEVSPLIQLDPANKVCPPEAWLPAPPDNDVFAKYLPTFAETSRQTDYREAVPKGLLCAELGVNITALADEGYVRHMPDPDRLLTALKNLPQTGPAKVPQRWTLYSHSLAQADSTLGLEVIDSRSTGADYQFLRA